MQIAERLISACSKWTQTQGITIIKLGVVTTNIAAIRCYTHCGFRVYGVETQSIYCDGKMYDELLMALHEGFSLEEVGK